MILLLNAIIKRQFKRYLLLCMCLSTHHPAGPHLVLLHRRAPIRCENGKHTHTDIRELNPTHPLKMDGIDEVYDLQ